MRIRRSVGAGGLLFAVLVSAGCPGDDTAGPGNGTVLDAGIDAPPDTKVIDSDDGPTDGPACSAGLKPFYQEPGCGGQAAAVCAASDDGCFGQEICLCDGRTSRKCTWSEAPFRHLGPCTDTDARTDRPDDGPDADVPSACSCGPGRTCPVNAIYATPCRVCECQPSGQALCQAILCPVSDGGEPAPIRCEGGAGACKGDCVFDQGCDTPRAYCSLTQCSNTFGGIFCGCDGVTFTSDCPRRAYRHVGACL